MLGASSLPEALARLDPVTEWPPFIAARERPFIELAEAVSRFRPPFERLAHVAVVFAPVKRFVLDRALAGDSDAASVVDDELAINRKLSLHEAYEFRDLLPAYRIRHAPEIVAFTRARYPWSVIADSLLPLFRLSGVGALLDGLMLRLMGDFGFDAAGRRHEEQAWRYGAFIAGHLVEIVFASDSLETRLSAYLQIPDLAYDAPLGDIFFYSGTVFPARERREQFEGHVSLFLSEYRSVFPFVASAAAQSIANAEPWWRLGLSRAPG